MSDNDSKAKDNPEVSNAPEPINPIRGSSYRGPSSLMARRVDTAPDWNYWRQMPHAELWKAVALSSNLDPRNSELGYQVGESVRWKSRYDDEEYKQAFEWLEIASARVEESEVVEWSENRYFTKVKLPIFAAWADSLGWPIPEDFKSMAKAADSEGNRKSGDSKAEVSIDRAHVSDKLAYLNQVAKKYWANVKRDDAETHPKNADVAAWLVNNAGYSQTLADKAATIIRPEWAPTGRKPKE